ncbi:cysteine synthase family protein [Spirosoma sp. KCTC 42546]|uniref:PLP-dependent cysteine synthase family protein n=1 Tax=Spirosoma sp. KCTC 42546 TaxID=2520506 RepID=UPI00115B4058|nr:cysteine synthase family protein [Spirosoma sp. KCTC 42546]QDK81572.1 cysteine synthase family protein [Spirosoma sp. KCTC 42546]
MYSPAYSALSAIGNTPFVQLRNIVPPQCADIFLKLEYLNPTGSYKDRMAQAIIEEAEQRGTLRPGMTVVECTAGSTGTALAFVCAVKGYRFRVISSDAFAKEKLQSMRALGADIQLVPSEGGRITPDLIPRMIGVASELAQHPENYWTHQFENRDAIEGYRKMGREILQQCPAGVNVFLAAVGTAGMLSGVSLELKQVSPGTQVIALEPAESPLLTQGVKGNHSIDGVGVGFIPPLLSAETYDEVRAVPEAQARETARLLAAREGIFAGTSTGLNVAAALYLGCQLGPGYTVVTVACDSGMKYLAGGLFDY